MSISLSESLGLAAMKPEPSILVSNLSNLSLNDEGCDAEVAISDEMLGSHFATPSLMSNLLPSGVLTPSPSTASGRVTASPPRVAPTQVSCSSCLKQFDRRERRPKLLDCVHTVCCVCLEDYNVQQRQQTCCPLCNRTTEMSADKLPLDVVTLAMSENYTLFSRNCCSNCDATGEQIGDQEATPLFWDTVCGIMTCEPCYDLHVRDSPPNSHKSASLIAVPSRISDEFYRQIRDLRNAPCPQHSNEMLNQYCYECNAFVCPDCVVNHQRHHLVREQLDFGTQFGVESDFYRIYIENLKPFLRNLDSMWPILQERASRLDGYVDGYEKQADNLFGQIIDKLKGYQEQTLEAVQRIRDEREEQLRQDEERLSALIHTGDRLIQWMMQSIDFCNTVELAAARQFVTNAYQELFQGLDGFSRTAKGPADTVQLPQLELFESAVLNILTSAENMVNSRQAQPQPQQQDRFHGGTPVLPPSSRQPMNHHQQPQQLVPFGSTMLSTTPSNGSSSGSSPSPLPGHHHHQPMTPSGPGSQHNHHHHHSPNPTVMMAREPTAAQRIPRQRMIYHLKFGEFGVMEGQFSEPSGIACNAQNDIIAADTNNHRVQIFDSEGRFKFTYGEAGKRDSQLLFPNRVAVAKATGDIVVTERSPSHQVQIYDQYGIFVRRFGQDSLRHPRGVFVDSRNRILVVECKVMRVTIFSMDGSVLKTFTCRSYLEFPNGICATDNPEEIYISDNRAHCVWVFNYDGIFLRRIGGEGITNYPIGVGINQLGEIIVADNHNNFNLTAFTPDGQVLYGLESKVKHAQVFDATLMNDGCVAIACKDYRVYVYRYMSASTRHLGLNLR